MKKIILLLLISYSGFAQENEFTFSEKGFTDFVIKNFESKNKEELYKKIIANYVAPIVTPTPSPTIMIGSINPIKVSTAPSTSRL